MRAALHSSLRAVALALVLQAVLPRGARAELYVVVHSRSPVVSLSRKEVIDLFMGRTRSFAGGELALPFDLAREHPVRERFYLALAGMSQAQVNSYWSRLMFSGQTLPPPSLPVEAAVVEALKRQPSAIGYLGSAPTDAGLRTVLVVKEGP